VTTNSNMAFYLLTIQGVLTPPTLEEARTIHNETAGAPASVAAAKSLGDLSHMVHVPMGPASSEFLILDVWNNMDGLNQFFANPQVQHQAGRIFSQRDPVVWTAADGFYAYHLPAPSGKNKRIVAVVRGKVRSQEDARTRHNTLAGNLINKARAAGNLSHEADFRLPAPGTPESLEFFAIDTWMDESGMNSHYSSPDLGGLYEMFVEPPATSVWIHPSGDWVEW